MNDTMRSYNFKVDTIEKKIIVYPNWDTLNRASFNYISDSVYLTLKGRMKDDSVFVKLRKYDERNFRLMNRGFHWINEYPYNR